MENPDGSTAYTKNIDGKDVSVTYTDVNVLLVESTTIELTEEPTTVYNFQVEDFHTYHVGEYGVLVHNAEKYTDLTRAQNKNVEKLDNIIENNLKDSDFSGTLADLKGDPIPKPNGGYWNHLTEMKQSYTALQKIKIGLEGSLKNPNLTLETTVILQEKLNTTLKCLNKIEDLFNQFEV